MEKRLSATCRTASFALAGYCEARANGGAYLRHRERHTARRPGPRENRHRKAYRTEEFSTIRETVHGTRANERRQGIPDGGIRTETQYGLRPGIRGLGRTDSGRHTGRRNSGRNAIRRAARRPGPRENRHRKAYRPEAFSTIRETVHGTRANERRQGIPNGGIQHDT